MLRILFGMPALVALIASSVVAVAEPLAAEAATDTNVAARVARSDIHVEQPNILPSQAMPLGNGRLGVALWAAQGLTAQLNRSDTLPRRLSPGWLVVPGLAQMVTDRGFRARLHLHDGQWRATGGGLTARAYVDQDYDRLVVEVGGADPGVEQTAQLQLWPPRTPQTIVAGDVALLAEQWRDDELPGASGRTFGSLAALTAEAREVRATRIDERTVEVRFRPMTDGSFRIIVAAPGFDGQRDPRAVANAVLSPSINADASQRRWHAFWNRVGLISATSADGVADYAEQLRTIFLYLSAAQSDTSGVVRRPGTQGGVGDMFSAVRDSHMWDPASYWFWNLRMMVAANLSAGLPELNRSVFELYRDNLDAIRHWTRAKMGGRPGICVPETMRFNGVGVEWEDSEFRPFPIVTHSCDLGWTSTSNARTLTTGAEIGLWVWETYLKTGDRDFLAENYPLMAESARFLAAYQKVGPDGLLHTQPSNAHETQHDTIDPTTDLSAIHMLYPAVIEASRILKRDAELAKRLAKALERTPPLPLEAAQGTPDPLLASDVSSVGPVIAPSYDRTARARNTENIALEPVWPYGFIGPEHALFDAARRSYAYRPFRYLASWSADPIHAARLGLAAEVGRSIFALVQLYQAYPNGMAAFLGPSGEFYLEQIAVVAAALPEALVQDGHGLLRIAPAIPAGWSVDGTALVRGNARVAVQVRDGAPRSVAINAGDTGSFTIANPWPSRQITLTGPSGTATLNGPRIVVPVVAGGRYTLSPHNEPPVSNLSLPPGVRTLGRASLGLGPPCCGVPENYHPADDAARRRHEPGRN